VDRLPCTSILGRGDATSNIFAMRASVSHSFFFSALIYSADFALALAGWAGGPSAARVIFFLDVLSIMFFQSVLQWTSTVCAKRKMWRLALARHGGPQCAFVVPFFAV